MRRLVRLVRFMLFLAGCGIIGAICASAGTMRPIVAAAGGVAAIVCLRLAFERQQCPTCGHVMFSMGGKVRCCLKCGTAYGGPLPLPESETPVPDPRQISD